MWVGITQSAEGLSRAKLRPSPSYAPGRRWSQVSGLWNPTKSYHVLGLQLVDCRSGDFLVSIVTETIAISYHTFPPLSIDVSCVFCLPGKAWLIHCIYLTSSCSLKVLPPKSWHLSCSYHRRWAQVCFSLAALALSCFGPVQPSEAEPMSLYGVTS